MVEMLTPLQPEGIDYRKITVPSILLPDEIELDGRGVPKEPVPFLFAYKDIDPQTGKVSYPALTELVRTGDRVRIHYFGAKPSVADGLLKAGRKRYRHQRIEDPKLYTEASENGHLIIEGTAYLWTGVVKAEEGNYGTEYMDTRVGYGRVYYGGVELQGAIDDYELTGHRVERWGEDAEGNLGWIKVYDLADKEAFIKEYRERSKPVQIEENPRHGTGGSLNEH